MPIIIKPSILDKLTNRHSVTEKEVHQCFNNIEGGLLIDTREDHKSNPPTLWFVAPTNKGRLLKIAYIQDKDLNIHIKTAYDANQDEIRIYNKYAK